MYIRIYTYIHVHTYIYTYTYIYIYTHIHLYAHAYIYMICILMNPHVESTHPQKQTHSLNITYQSIYDTHLHEYTRVYDTHEYTRGDGGAGNRQEAM